ncbi:MAG TPA: hypothetical protein ENL20_02165 [Candidatus Cloacimonetes bacterium]|nr:hypothetical protein [Candidatus Cloacimonadota bacterium]
MNKIKKKQLSEKIKNIPEQKGIFSFSDNEKILYVCKTSNIKKRIEFFQNNIGNDKTILQLMSLTETIEWEITPTLFSALIKEKKIISSKNPEFNYQLKPYSSYVYLGIDFYRPPYFRITENTQGELFYLGPFRDRFFLHDFMQTMMYLFQYPACEDENYPCRFYQKKICTGFCLQDSKEINEIIQKFYLFPNFKILENIDQKREELSQNLEFQKADLVQKQSYLISKYYQILKFLHTTKSIEMEFSENNIFCKIKKGKLSELNENGVIQYFESAELNYRKNEKLALEKDQLDEMWIIYDFLHKTYPKEIDKIYSKSISTTNIF